jgi:hypothetical protein
MPWMLNPAGQDVFIPKAAWERIVQRGHQVQFRPRPHLFMGTGEPNRVAVIYQSHNGANGLGDHLHAMPALAAKVAEGFKVHVYTAEFFRPFVESVGCIWEDWKPLGIGWMARAQKEYGTVYSLLYWCIRHDENTYGDVTTTRFQQMADYLQVKLPEHFSWRERLINAKKTHSETD